MGVHLDERPDGGFALYIDGDFQFDTSDEAIYHESMALPALSLARRAAPGPLRVLICGGGDGLALRECLRFPDVASVDLVDYDPAIVALARERFSEINANAFDDDRVQVHFRDAWEFVQSNNVGDYDVILCDFTVPRAPEQTRIFTREWYALLKGALAPHGVMAINAFSPQTTPEAVWCLDRTVRAAGLSALPYRVCIPSFREHGYGAWAFLLAANRPLVMADLRGIECPVETRQADLARLWRGARFHRDERRMGRAAPVHSLENDCLLALLLNPGLPARIEADEPVSPDIEPLLRLIPISHPYHTRTMIETLAEQVAATVSQIDVRRLLDALLRRAARLPQAIREELTRLRDFLSGAGFSWDRFLLWGARLFAALVILMTLANAIAPDNAFAKGSAGLGHASMSRGYASSSFGGARGISGSAGRANSFSGASSRGSFGRSGAFGSHSIFTTTSAPAVHSTGFRSGYGYGRPVDVYGDYYNISPFHYYYGGTRYYFGSHATAGIPSGPQEEHKALFAADDDMLVMDNGDVIVTLSDKAYLLVTGGKVVLRSKDSPDPLLDLYPDPVFFDGIIAQLRDRQAAIAQAVSVRRDWLSWVGWTGAMLPAIAQDKLELKNMTDLGERIDAAIVRLGSPPAKATPMPALKPNEVELFIDARLRADGSVGIRQADDTWIVTDGATMTPETGGKAAVACPPALTAALRSVLAKLKKEMAADIAQSEHDLSQYQRDLTSLNSDLATYNNLYQRNGANYEVDYGSEEIDVDVAMSKTRADIAQTKQDTATEQQNHDKLVADRARLDQAAAALRP
ncbi:MAG TPA: hypothetical protein VKT77_04425 [Chthonomonadaceae bacterium]|nr:hypothetical protein [Chthonomonadaceae bacterium]